MFLHATRHGSASERPLPLGPRTKDERRRTKDEGGNGNGNGECNSGNGDIVENMHVKLVTQELLPKAKRRKQDGSEWQLQLGAKERCKKS